jgi:thioredoxin-related protein
VAQSGASKTNPGEIVFIMNKNSRNIVIPRLFVPVLFILLFSKLIQAQDITLTIHLRGVYESKISLLPLTGVNSLKPISIIQRVKNGETTTLQVSQDHLPCEFVLRFDYKENPSSTPYPSEKRIIINDQDLDLWVHPIYCSNADSTWFQKDERENKVYLQFLQEINKQKEMLVLLQNFLLNYDDIQSAFYQKGIKEYEKRLSIYNRWIADETTKFKALFVSSLFGFNHIPQIDWTGSESERKQSLMENYFEGMDFNDTLKLKSSMMKEWIDAYVNLYGELATSIELRDSLFTLAGKTAIEKARSGHPLVYGWMVDYFFNGYESFNIEQGIKMLQPYLDDPNCLTSKRQSINRRLEGMETLVPGTSAPDIFMQDAENIPFELYSYQTAKEYILLLFWSADCSHCKEMVNEIHPWFQQAQIKEMLDIIAISMDETDKETQVWNQKIQELTGWIHLQAKEGLNSKVAADYYILGIPVMILVNAKTKEIIALPESIEDLNDIMGI